VWREVANIAGLGCRGFFAHDRSIDCPLDLGTVIGMKAPSPVLCPGAWPSPRGASCPTCVNSARIIRGGSRQLYRRGGCTGRPPGFVARIVSFQGWPPSCKAHCGPRRTPG
jgi:hypothetical protein